MPARDDIDLLDLEFAIGSISLIDVTDQSPRFQIRMIGSQVVERHGQENNYECLILPLADEARQVVQLMSVLEWPDGATAKSPQERQQPE